MVNIETYDIELLEEKQPSVQLVNILLNKREKGFAAIHYTDGTIVVNERHFQVSPESFSELEQELKSKNITSSKFGFAELNVIDKELDRAKKLISITTHDSVDDSEAQVMAVDICTYALVNKCSDIHLFLRDPHSEIRFNQHGRATAPLFTAYDYARLVKMIARMFNWSGANNATSEFSTMTIDATTLTIDLEVGDKKIPTRLRIEKAPLEKKGDLKVVLRVSPAVQSKKLSDMNIDRHIQDVVQQHMQKPSGMIIVTGPTGAGKTTFLHGALHEIPYTSFCSTIEDPVELLADFNPLISQHNLDKKVGYYNQIRSLLRQDPNIIMIGEMRDEMTAQAAIRAALTGHLVVTTLHTNNSLGVISRLEDLGITYKNLGLPDILSLLVAIRLIPIVCPQCSSPLTTKHIHYKKISNNPLSNVDTIKVKNKKGCRLCIEGVIGRKPIIEYVHIDAPIREYINNGDITGAKEYIISNGWQSMQDLAWIDINNGLIDPMDAEENVKDVVFDNSQPFKYLRAS